MIHIPALSFFESQLQRAKCRLTPKYGQLLPSLIDKNIFIVFVNPDKFSPYIIKKY